MLACLIAATLSVCSTPTQAEDAKGVGAVTGTIVDAKDQPIVGLTVRLVATTPMTSDRGPVGGKGSRSHDPFDQEPNQLADRIVARATTDAQGKFTMTGIPVGPYLLRGGTKSIGIIYEDVIVEADKTKDVGTLKLVKIGA